LDPGDIGAQVVQRGRREGDVERRHKRRRRALGIGTLQLQSLLRGERFRRDFDTHI
jgi:hypothetical protein